MLAVDSVSADTRTAYVRGVAAGRTRLVASEVARGTIITIPVTIE